MKVRSRLYRYFIWLTSAFANHLNIQLHAEYIFPLESYQCPEGQSEETITVNGEADLAFLVAKKTPHNLDCQANYVMGSCSRVELECDFKMKGKDKAAVMLGINTIT